MLVTLFVALLFANQEPATGQPTGPAPVEQAAGTRTLTAAQERESAVVCRREPVTGSNRTRRICERQGVIDYNRQQAQRWHDSVMSGMGTPDCVGDPGSPQCTVAERRD